ncbi:VWA domain-containing protein, partial [Pelomonas sp. UHG3]
GSMAGDSLASAKSVIHGVMNQLGDADSVSVTRFGSTVEHLLAPSRAVAEVKHRIQPAIARMEADLGGTEMALALRAVFELQGGTAEVSKDVLLLTDGEIWEIDAILASAVASQHRIFVIGLGASPAEGVLRALAEKTGGTAEFVTPGEAFEAAAKRMLARMRQPRHCEASVSWGEAPVWQTQLPSNVYGGDTVVAFAGFAAPCVLAPRLLAKDDRGHAVLLSSASASTESSGATLSRMAAAKRMAHCDEREALALALSHQLLSSQTHCILVHVREANDKATDEAQLHQVQSMLAAGWGATSSVMAAPALGALASAPTAWRHSRAGMPAPDFMLSVAGAFDFSCEDEPTSSCAQHDESGFATMRMVAQGIHAYLLTAGNIDSLDNYCWSLSIHNDLRDAIEEVGALVAEPSVAWLLLAHWINSRSGGLGDPELSNALTAPLSRLDRSIVNESKRTFDRSLGLYGLDDWKSSRLRRLTSLLNRAAG